MSEPRASRRRTAAPLIGGQTWPWLIVALLVLIAACSTPPAAQSGEVRIAGGAIQSRAWSVWARNASATTICLVVRVAGDEDQSLCNVTRDSASVWQVDTSVGRIFAGVTDAGRAAVAIVRLADGTSIRGPVAATTNDAIAAFVVPLPAGALLSQLELRDDADAVVDTVSLK